MWKAVLLALLATLGPVRAARAGDGDAPVDRERLRKAVTLPASAGPRGWYYTLEPDGRVLASGDTDARRDLTALRTAAARDDADAQLWTDLASAYRRAGDANRATECVARAVAVLRKQSVEHPDDGATLAALGLALHAAGDEAGAERSIATAAAAPRNAWAGLAASGDLAVIRGAAKAAGRAFATCDDAQRWLGRDEQRAMRLDGACVDEAERRYSAALESLAGPGVAGTDVASVCARRHTVHAIRFARATASDDPKGAATARARADADERRALEALPDDPFAVLLLVLADAMGEPDAEGNRRVRRSADLPPEARAKVEGGEAQLRKLAASADAGTSARALQAVACAQWFVHQDGAAAESALRKSVAKDPRRDSSWNALIHVLGGSGRGEDLTKLCREWNATGDASARKRMLLAVLLATAGDTDGAEKEWRAALALDPGGVETNLGLAALVLRRAEDDADLAEAARRIEVAKAAVAAAGDEADPGLSAHCDLLEAVALGLSGDVAGAERAARRLIRAAGEIPVAREILGAIGK
jgi:tetratricopeptide (TPR) repeat protein